MSCSTSSFAEDTDYGTGHEGEFEEVILSPTYSECSGSVNMNRCSIRLRLDAAEAEQFEFFGTPSVECGPGLNHIEVTNGLCAWGLVTPQVAGSASATAEEGEEAVSLNLAGSGLAYAQAGACGPKESENGTYSGEILLRGYDEKGEPDPIQIVE